MWIKPDSEPFRLLAGVRSDAVKAYPAKGKILKRATESLWQGINFT